MKSLRVLGLIIAVSLVVITMAPGLKAENDVWNKKTTMRFSEPFEIPGGQTLPAGTYIFKLLDSDTNREIVQIFNEDLTHIYATVITIPNYRAHLTEETVVRFQERTSGSPQAIKTWFHPNEELGHEFVYPKERAMELAKLANTPVPSMPSELTPDITLPIHSAKDAPAVALEHAPIKVEEPSGTEVTVAEAFAPAPLQAESLPKTASSLPLIGLIGLFSLTAGLTLWLVSKRFIRTE